MHDTKSQVPILHGSGELLQPAEVEEANLKVLKSAPGYE